MKESEEADGKGSKYHICNKTCLPTCQVLACHLHHDSWDRYTPSCAVSWTECHHLCPEHWWDSADPSLAAAGQFLAGPPAT